MKVLVAVLHMGSCRVEVADVLLKLQQDGRHDIDIGFFTSVPGESNRNTICKKVVDDKYDYVVMIDNDNPPTKNPLDLIDFRLDIIGLPTPTFKGKIMMAVKEKAPDGEMGNRDGLQEVEWVGSGCLVLSRKVLEEIKAPFMRVWNENGIAVVGQDKAFCERAKEKGFRVWVHWDYVCSHFKEIDLLTV